MIIQQPNISVTIILLFAAFLSFYFKKLTLTAAITGFFCALIIYLGTGYTGLLLLAVFFITGTLATAWGRRSKQKAERAGDHGRRKAGQVLANGGAATLIALLALLIPGYTSVLSIMLASTLASATSDTLSSELGMVYGKNFYHCISWKKDERGLDGVVSIEGSLIGIFGSALIALLYCIFSSFFDFPASLHAAGIPSVSASFFIITIAGICGNFSDSLLGATLERNGKLNNDAVNFLSTVISGTVSCVLFVSFLLF